MATLPSISSLCHLSVSLCLSSTVNSSHPFLLLFTLIHYIHSPLIQPLPMWKHRPSSRSDSTGPFDLHHQPSSTSPRNWFGRSKKKSPLCKSISPFCLSSSLSFHSSFWGVFFILLSICFFSPFCHSLVLPFIRFSLVPGLSFQPPFRKDGEHYLQVQPYQVLLVLTCISIHYYITLQGWR